LCLPLVNNNPCAFILTAIRHPLQEERGAGIDGG
jgi:hypothetical protein